MHPPILCATDGGEVIVERGVIVGGLMICGSFLLAAMLNRSAMEEAPAPVPPPAVIQPLATPGAANCAEVSPRVETNVPVVEVEAPAADLMVNGRDACPR
jgi:hypothetical protein